MGHQNARRGHHGSAAHQARKAALALAFCATLLAAPASQARPAYFYFPEDWCPRADEFAQIDEAFNTIPMRGTCCLISGSTRNPEAPLTPPLEAKIRAAGKLMTPPATCTGRVLTAAEEAAQEAEEKRRADELEKAAAARQLIDGPAALRALTPHVFCVAYGRALRSDEVMGLWSHEQAPAWARKEARRRGLKMDDARIIDQRFRLGDSQCHMYAALGLPRSENRTVIPGVEHIQHVYGHVYFYTRNGRVTSFQD